MWPTMLEGTAGWISIWIQKLGLVSVRVTLYKGVGSVGGRQGF